MPSRSPRRRDVARRNLPLVGMIALLVLVVGAFAASRLLSSDDVTTSDLPRDLVEARPSMSEEDGRFILEAQRRGADLTPERLDNDIETAHTVCWALTEGKGAVHVRDLAVRDDDTPLGTTGDDLRARRIIAAGITAYCPAHDDEIAQLGL